MCINSIGDSQLIDNCEALVAEQKIKIQQLEEDLQQHQELCVNLQAQLKAVENTCASGFPTEFEIAEERIGLIASLQKSQEIYQILIKNHPNSSVFLFDRDLRYTLVDGQGLTVVGLSKELLKGKTLREISPPESFQFFESKYRDALAGKEHNFEYKYRDHIYLTTIVPVKNDREEILAGMVITQDITEQKQAEIALQVMKNDLIIKYRKRSEDLKIANQQLREEIIDRWRTEEALRESQQQLELFFSQSLDGFFFMMLGEAVQWDDTVDKEKVLDYVFANGLVTKANDALLAQYGAARQEFIGLTLNFLSSHNLAGGRDVIKKLFEAGRIHIECYNRKFDGTPIWVEGNYICIYDTHGRIKGYFGVQRDISGRKKAEAALTESEERFRQLAENIESVFWTIDFQQDKLIYISPAYEKIWDRTRADLYAFRQSFTDFVHPEDRDEVRAAFSRLIVCENDNDNDNEIEYRIVRPDGEIRWIRDRAFPIKNSNGKIYRIVGIAEDISHRKRVEKALRESEERFRQLAENIQDSFWLISFDFRDVLYLSPAYEQIWGRTREDFYANNCDFMDWIYPEDKHFLLDALPRVLLGESTSTEYRIVWPDGTIRWVCDRAFPIYDELGKVYRIAGICEDISDRKLAEARLQAALREKEVLLKEIHHRVKNNMQVISSLLQLQTQYIEDEATLSLFEESQTRIHSMALIHEQLYQSDSLAQIDIQTYVENLVANLFQSFGCCNDLIEFNVNIDPIFLNIETAIPCGLIINELVSNSLKYAFPSGVKGEIKIDFHQVLLERFHLSIQDNGSGFPADFNVENTETLGVRLVKMLAEQLDGEILINTHPGTCYHLIFKELNYRRRI